MFSSRRWHVLFLSCLLNACLAAGVSTFECDRELELAEENHLLQVETKERRFLPAGEDVEIEYAVTQDHIQTNAPGLAYRVSMDLEDRDPFNSLVTWGSTVPGVPIGTDWLKVGTRYLPMRVSGHPVLERVALSDVAALSVIRQQPAAGAAEPEASQSEAAPPEAAQSEAAQTEPEDVETRARGGVGRGGSEDAEGPVVPEPEVFDGVVVEFGVIFRSFPVLDFQASTYTASLAFSQRWPSDASSYDAAAVGDGENPWSPNLVVTNHDIAGLEVISTSTFLNQTTGMITQVDYLTLRARQTFTLKNFPFDTQVLSVRVAPKAPGSVAMKLVPVLISGEPTLDPAILQGRGFRFASVNEEAGAAAAEDLSEFADPSRGVVEVALERRTAAYFSSLFLPPLLILAVCWSIFFLPLPDSAVATPRAAGSVTVFLGLLIFMLHVEQLVPARFSRMWIDVFTENVAVLVSAAVAFNTLEQFVHSQMKLPVLAGQFGRELRVLFPSHAAFVLSLCWCATCGETLTYLSVVCRIVQIITVLGYIGSAYMRALFSDEGKPRGPMTFLPAR